MECEDDVMEFVEVVVFWDVGGGVCVGNFVCVLWFIYCGGV